jgi:hypothetical protein
MKSKIVQDEFNMAFLSCGVSGHYLSMTECMDYLQARYAPAAVAPDPLPGAGRPFPPYLFRGESGIYDTTHSVRARIELTFPGQMGYAQKRLSDMIQYCDERLAVTVPGFLPQERTAFLQHYGLPSYGLNVTADLNTAAYFASSGDTNRVKLITVIDTKKPVQHRPLPLDLSSGLFGTRPLNQQAFAILLGRRDNLKHPLVADMYGIQWYSYILTETDQLQYHTSSTFLMGSDGYLSALVPAFVKEYESAYGRIHPKLKPFYNDNIRVASII